MFVRSCYKALLLMFMLVLCCLPNRGQELGLQTADDTIRLPMISTHTQVGVGMSNVYHTYLSPLHYTGHHLMGQYVRQRPAFVAVLGSDRLLWQGVWRGVLAKTASATASIYQIDLSYATRWLYTWRVQRSLHVRAGLGIEGHVGGLYHSRNGNNPATADVALYAPLTLQARYGFRLLRQPAVLSYQMDMPVVGVQWAPRYTQSYYEMMELGRTRGVLAAVWAGQVPSWRQQLCLSLPIGQQRVSIGLYSDVRQHTLRGNKHHAWHNGISIGYVRQLRLYSAKAQTHFSY